MQPIILGFLSGLVVLALIYVSNMLTAERNRVADCVVVEAYAQGYAGNPYSREAWNTFAPSCK